MTCDLSNELRYLQLPQDEPHHHDHYFDKDFRTFEMTFHLEKSEREREKKKEEQ